MDELRKVKFPRVGKTKVNSNVENRVVLADWIWQPS
jgi:hypothetical protein